MNKKALLELSSFWLALLVSLVFGFGLVWLIVNISPLFWFVLLAPLIAISSFAIYYGSIAEQEIEAKNATLRRNKPNSKRNNRRDRG